MLQLGIWFGCLCANAQRNYDLHSTSAAGSDRFRAVAVLMGFLSNTAKKIVFWNYPRTSWQWDVLCVVILVFIFLTPKSWFKNTEFRPQRTVVLPAEVIGAQADRSSIERQARELAGQPESRVTAVRERRDSAGKLIGYEVDIR